MEANLKMDNIENPQTQKTFHSVLFSKLKKRIIYFMVIAGCLFLIVFLGSAITSIIWGH
jgi:hypothetical protein